MKLYDPFKLGTLQLANRMVMAPMTRSRADNNQLAATELHARYYGQRASAGLIISEGTVISPHATGYVYVPGIYTQAQIDGWKLTTNAVHNKNGKIFAQLWHVGRVSHPDLLHGEIPLAPSAINPNYFAYTFKGKEDTIEPRAMTKEDITNTIQDFRQAALNAIQAGFDGVELHGANGYLINQFLAKCANTRTDEYGGTIENRARFLFELLDTIGEDIELSKVAVRLSPSLNNTFGIVPDDETTMLYEYLFARLNDYGLAYVHISGFSYDTVNPQSYVLKEAGHYRKYYKGNLIINGGFDKPLAESAIADGTAELVAFGKLFISNPDLVERFKTDASLNPVDSETFYTGGSKGYVDYKFLTCPV